MFSKNKITAVVVDNVVPVAVVVVSIPGVVVPVPIVVVPVPGVAVVVVGVVLIFLRRIKFKKKKFTICFVQKLILTPKHEKQLSGVLVHSFVHVLK